MHWSGIFAKGIDSGFILIAWAALYFGIKHHRALEEQTVRLIVSEAAARTAQLQALQYQLQPHFLFNTLNAISSLVVSRQAERATDMLARLGDLLRNTLQTPERHTVSLREELEMINEYVEIEKVRFGPRLIVLFDVQPDANGAEVPRFLLQPLVENAIRHGIAQRPKGGSIAIRAGLVDAALRIEVESDQLDSSTGAAAGVGVGLRNSTQRLEMLYGSAARLMAGTASDGRFLVAITVPFRHSSSDLENVLVGVQR